MSRPIGRWKRTLTETLTRWSTLRRSSQSSVAVSARRSAGPGSGSQQWGFTLATSLGTAIQDLGLLCQAKLERAQALSGRGARNRDCSVRSRWGLPSCGSIAEAHVAACGRRGREGVGTGKREREGLGERVGRERGRRASRFTPSRLPHHTSPARVERYTFAFACRALFRTRFGYRTETSHDGRMFV